MRLSCKHIFAVRSQLDLPLFDACLCDRRWSSSYYKENQRIFRYDSADTCSQPVCQSVDVHRVEPKKKKVYSQVKHYLYMITHAIYYSIL